jgi:hypothetical protein
MEPDRGYLRPSDSLHCPRHEIGAYQRRQCRSLLVVLVYFFLFAAGVLSHLGPNEEMPHRYLDHVKAIDHLIDILRPNVLLRLFEKRALVSPWPVWPELCLIPVSSLWFTGPGGSNPSAGTASIGERAVSTGSSASAARV